jgi:hypothetical protein
MRALIRLTSAVAIAALCPLLAPVRGQAPVTAEDTRDRNLRAYTDLLRSDIRAQKVAIIAGIMQFTEEEEDRFWPVYREYEQELARINDDRIALIAEYGASYQQMTDAMADRLARGALELEARRHSLKAKYYDRLATVLPAKSAARFLQVENQILLLLDLQIAASLPIVE